MDIRSSAKYGAKEFAALCFYLERFFAWRERNFPGKCSEMALRLLLCLAKAPNGSLTHKQLYISMPCAVPTTRGWLKVLSEKGFIEVNKSFADRRLSNLVITEAGYKSLMGCLELSKQHFDSFNH